MNQNISDVVYELLNDYYELSQLPSLIINHIDYDGIARDLELDGNYTVINNHVYEYYS